MARVGIVVVSHSHALAEAAVGLATAMVTGDEPPMAIAAGTPDGGFGTDAMEVMSAVEQVDEGAGVVILVDLGSAVMSAEMALEFLDGRDDVRIVAAPFVEGLLAATVRASVGASLDEVSQEAFGALAPKLDALGVAGLDPSPAGGDALDDDPSADASEWATAVVGVVNEAGLHARPASAIASMAAAFAADVVIRRGDKRVSAASPIALATLNARLGDELTVEARGPESREAVAKVAGFIADGCGEGIVAGAEPDEPTSPAAPPSGPRGVSPGRVIGPARTMSPPPQRPSARRISPADTGAEQARLGAALTDVAADYRARAKAAAGQAAAILDATAELAVDRALRERADARIADGSPAETALWDAASEVAAELGAAGGLIAERATDLVDVRNRTVARLLGTPPPGVPDGDGTFVLIAHDLAPADTAGLDPERCLGIVSALGGPTSHTSILARSLGIAAVIGYAEPVPDGATVLVDGATGEVIVDPDPARCTDARTGPVRLEPLTKPGRTADGAAIHLLANIADARDAAAAARAGAEGVGLFRTEVAFLGLAEEPTVEEQTRLYQDVLDEFPGRRVVIRTLDAGSDKPIPFVTTGQEPNPALGVRGYRTAAGHPDVLRRQLDAIVAAASQATAEVWVMAPMISTIDEASAFVDLARGAGLQKVGVMIETPSAALCADEILDVVDFASVGTNDLTQYVMAADREATSLGALQDSWQPAVLRALRAIGEAATKHGKPLGVCGEAASDPLLGPVLVGLGVTSLSMGPRALSAVAQGLVRHSMEDCRATADAALAEPTPVRARAVAGDRLGG